MTRKTQSTQRGARERVIAVLEHRQPDRVPIDLGGWQSGISYETYEPLKKFLGVDAPTRLEERNQGLAWVDEEVLDRFGVDTRYIFPKLPSDDDLVIREDDQYTDPWGIVRRRPKGSHYYDIARAPLEGKDRDAVESHPWPYGGLPYEEEAMRAELARQLGSGCALFSCLAGVFEQATYLRGMEEFYTDVYTDPSMFEAILDKVLEVELSMYERFFGIVGEHLDVVQFWGDLGSQKGPLIDPDHYRRYIKPREAALVEYTKQNTSARVCLHTCGSAYAFIPDLIDAGYDLLNPVQTTALDMEPVRLKREFGRDLVFWGSIDTQSTLPFGSEQDVRAEVRAKIDTLGDGGGYILAPCHNIQAGTPARNVAAMYDEAQRYGVYG